MWVATDSDVEHHQLPGTQIHVWWYARLHNPDELLKHLADLVQAVPGSEPPTGEYVAMAWDGSKDRIAVTRDAGGAIPGYLVWNPSGVSLALSGGVARRMPGADLSLDQMWAAAFIGMETPVPTVTAFRGVMRIPVGGVVLGDRLGRPELLSTHRYDIEPSDELGMDPTWPERYREVLYETVHERVNLSGVHGFEQSAGLDSSSISAVASAQRSLGDCHAVGFGKWGMPEARAVQLAGQKGFGRAHIIFAASVEPKPNRERVPEILGWPSSHPDAASYLSLWQLCQTLGVTVLHSGYGGDQAVTFPAANSGYAVAARQGHLRGIRDLGLVMRPKDYVRLRNRAVREATNVTKHSALENTLLTPAGKDLLRAHPAKPPPQQGPTPTNTLVRDYMLDVQMQNRIEYVFLMAAAFGVSYTFPLLDPRLVSAYLAAPDSWKWHGGHGRYLHRSALVGLLPEDMLWAPKGPMFNTARRSAPQDSRGIQELTLAMCQELLDDLNPALVEFVDQHAVSDHVSRLQNGSARLPTVAVRVAVNLNRWLNTS